MRALSYWQPWATAVALGLKRIETRSWATSYRGLIAHHAAQRWTREEREFLDDMRSDGFFPAKFIPIPRGAIVAVGRLVDIKRTEHLAGELTALEREWGNYGPKRYGWLFEDVRPLPEPVPWKGERGVFEIPDEILPPEFRQ
jgi:hypothetical protein